MASQNPPKIVAYWLFAMAALIAIMVCVGGATRLTDSGLSITQWDLVMGTLPPLSQSDWEEAFSLYKQIPEYERVNAGMSLSEFKEIFWWEWGHRNLGRFIGLAFALPLAFFSLRGMVTGGLRLKLWGLFALVCLQGAIGWYMVASGLSERVDVSQYRLALHLGTAFLLFCLTVWQALAISRPQGQAAAGGLAAWAWAGLALAFGQITLGAFVAGLRAGYTYNEWPMMDGRFVPTGYFGEPARFSDLFERVAAVQFNHRIGAYLLLAFAAAFAVKAWRAGGPARRHGLTVFGVVTAQALLGIVTLVLAVPLWLGIAHQAGALIVLTALVAAAFALTPAREEALATPRQARLRPAT
jgi:cytochrome c oxidase assembly protein subunit 15